MVNFLLISEMNKMRDNYWFSDNYVELCRYSVSLVGIKQDLVGATIQLNPGPRHIMKPTDICFYMSITKEENSAFILAHPNEDKDGIFSRHGSIKALARVHSHRYTKVTSIITTVGQLPLFICWDWQP